LNSMLDRLARGLEDRRRFVADASHELRTPLAVMRSELDVGLRDPDLHGGARETLTSTVQEVERMQAIVENLLTLARADDGSLGLLREEVDLLQVANAVAASSEPRAKSADVHIAVSGPSARAYADRLRIEQVLNNLVQNAIRYSPPASEICVETWEDGTVVGCSVRDAGPGVPGHIADRIFERFVRADPTRSQDGGSGLGLAISREIVAAHGGEIWLDAGSNCGASFSFRVPRAATTGLGEA
jgi:signal transduction histidine kinase